MIRPRLQISFTPKSHIFGLESGPYKVQNVHFASFLVLLGHKNSLTRLLFRTRFFSKVINITLGFIVILQHETQRFAPKTMFRNVILIVLMTFVASYEARYESHYEACYEGRAEARYEVCYEARYEVR